MAAPKNELAEKYNFLHTHIAKEVNIYDVLEEISLYQAHALTGESDTLATLELLRSSRNIKIPFNATRNKNISYLLELLVKNYPEEVKPIISFEFRVDPITKQLAIDQMYEFSLQLNNEKFNQIQEERDKVSVESLLKLLGNFRLFNLTKLIKKSKNKAHLSKLIKSELGINIFTFKNFTIDKHNLEGADDLCFHQKNYEAVKSKLNIDNIQKIISEHSVQIKRRLQKFGILNTEFSDYRDSKLDYLLNILLEDIPSSLGPKDLMETKNFNSLRSCLLKVDKIIDPLITISKDIVKYIKDHGICKENDIISIFDSLTPDMLKEWAEKNGGPHRIISYTNASNASYYINGLIFLPELANLQDLVIHDEEKFSGLLQTVQQEKTVLMEMLCDVGRTLLSSQENALHILKNKENVEKLKSIIAEYDDFLRRQAMPSSKPEKDTRRKKKSALSAIVSFIKSLFGSKGEDEGHHQKHGASHHASGSGGGHGHGGKIPLSKETTNIYSKIKTNKAPLIPISNYIEIIPENETRIDSIIQELRGNNLKIVIPIYNARAILYPIRSQNFIIADIDYLLVNSDIINTREEIDAYISSLAGFKLKDEGLTANGVVAIEKYLLTLHRQKRAQLKREKQNRIK
ncbi:MAG: hypothetical protein GY754_38610 [bacterium]|nr:hypothetical protein [bacterium]